jgi:hypothetical protein
MQYLSGSSLNRCVFDFATEIGLYSHQGIDINKVMKNNNLLIEHKQDKKIYVIERFVVSNYGRELSHVCGYMQGLDLT